MHRRSVLGSSVTVAVTALAGCALPRDELAGLEAWVEDTFVLVESVGDALEAWAEDPDSVPLSEFESLADETTEHLDRFGDEVEPLEEELRDGDLAPDDWDDVDGDDVWTIIDRLRSLLERSETGTAGIVEADGRHTGLDDEERNATETVLVEYEDTLEEAEPLVSAT